MTANTRSEKSIELAVVKFAKDRGFLIRKMNGAGYRGWPDRAFFKNGKCFFIEFKRLGKKLDPLQVTMKQVLGDRGFRSYMVDDVEKGKAIVAMEDE